MVYHILNGDALVDRFKATGLPGEIVVTRECLIEGDLAGNTREEFYQTRAGYLASTYDIKPSQYFDDVVAEFEKLTAASELSEFNLWFGYDLFCRVNMWFVISLLKDLSIDKKIYAVYPSYLEGGNVWLDFGGATPEQFLWCYNNRVLFNEKDLQLADELWQAYKQNDLEALREASKQLSPCFPYLEEVCLAHIERFPGQDGKGRPERVIEEILQGSAKDFPSVFHSFYKREGIYGFGDTQIKKIYDKLVQEH